MFESIFDDGSTLTYDAAGNVVSHTDASGTAVAVPPAEGSPIVQQFSNLFNYGIRAAIDKYVSPGASAAPGTVQAQTVVAQQQAQTKLLLVLAVGGFILFKLLK